MRKDINIIYIDFKDTNLEFDIADNNVTINKIKKLKLTPTYNTKIYESFLKSSVYLNIGRNVIENKDRDYLYLSSRSIMIREDDNRKLYMDLLVYNPCKGVLYENALNRSLGHKNDINELEIHQVLSGQIISLLKSPDGEDYLGFFSEGDYLEIPPGWFHCTYVAESPAVVANFYCNTYWENNIEHKPYFEVDNDICIESISLDRKFKILKKDNIDIAYIDSEHLEELCNIGIKPYSSLYTRGILNTKNINKCASIFDLFYLI